MEKILSMIFCCSMRSKDDGDDKIHQRTTSTSTPSGNKNTSNTSSTAANNSRQLRTNSPASNTNVNQSRANDDVNKNRNVMVNSNGEIIENEEDEEDDDILNSKQKISSKKDLLDDAHSETDTITNTNEESNTTPKLQHQDQQDINQNDNNIITTGINEEDQSMNNNEADIPQLSTLSVSNEVHNQLLELAEVEITPTKPPRRIIVAGETDEEFDDELDEEDEEDEDDEEEDTESYLDLTKLQEGQAYNPETGYLLGHKDKNFAGKKCLILDLDETLVHSSFKYLRTADFVIPVEIDNQIHHVYVIKRPGVDEFLKRVGQWYEVVVFTASVLKYGDPLLDKLDVYNSVHHRLFRDSCYNYQGNFIKNLSQIGRPLSDTIIIDNSPASYIFHPQHSIPISSWFSDTHDNELLDLLPLLEDLAKSNVDDVGLVLDISL